MPACVLLIVAVALAAYAGSLGAPFVFDDGPAILANPTLSKGWGAFQTPLRSPVSGRPLLNASYALNAALGGTDPRGYHALNLLVHLLAGLALLGIARRTLARPALGLGSLALPTALFTALLWVAHPLNTEAVTYVSERAECLMGLFYLGTLYAFVRAEAGGARAWWVVSVASCLLGALTKEVIATVPLVVLLYDRTFCAGSFGQALSRRWRYYLCLALAWPLIAHLSLGTGERGVGFGSGVSGLAYAMTSCRSVVHYLGLCLWPHPLVFDYGTGVIRSPTEALPFALAVGAGVAACLWALRRRPVAGFALAWFLLILAPTSSFVPLAYQPMAEHRVYLSLAAVAAVLSVAAHRLVGRRAWLILGALSVCLVALTHQRNRDYRSEEALWTDTVAKRPDNARAHANLGAALAKLPGRAAEAQQQDEAALRIDPDDAEAHNNLGLVLAQAKGDLAAASAHFEAAIRLRPDYAEARDNLGMALAGMPGRLPDAVEAYRQALQQDPGYAKAHNDLGIALARTPGRLDAAVAEFETALRLRPDYAEAAGNLETARQLAAQERGSAR